MFFQLLGKIIFKISGWKVVNLTPDIIPNKALFIAAPHTSNWDFLYGILGFYMAVGKVNFLIKKSLFFFPLWLILKSMGGIPVDRSKRNNFVDDLTDKFNSGELKYLIITPEGTRSKTKKWRSGFYRILEKADVPLYLAYLDYKDKHAGILTGFKITNNYEQDIANIKKCYAKVNAKYPENFDVS